eukprot:GILK01014498.1.p1 GENE.GILK01014498.1~~GILK01014498.1.p1  ORF type:complete len:425 (+),score=44.81 GILK01014498.1:28-1275(+)
MATTRNREGWEWRDFNFEDQELTSLMHEIHWTLQQQEKELSAQLIIPTEAPNEEASASQDTQVTKGAKKKNTKPIEAKKKNIKSMDDKNLCLAHLVIQCSSESGKRYYMKAIGSGDKSFVFISGHGDLAPETTWSVYKNREMLLFNRDWENIKDQVAPSVKEAANERVEAIKQHKDKLFSFTDFHSVIESSASTLRAPPLVEAPDGLNHHDITTALNPFYKTIADVCSNLSKPLASSKKLLDGYYKLVANTTCSEQAFLTYLEADGEMFITAAIDTCLRASESPEIEQDKIIQVILSIHSTRDVCGVCGPLMTYSFGTDVSPFQKLRAQNIPCAVVVSSRLPVLNRRCNVVSSYKDPIISSTQNTYPCWYHVVVPPVPFLPAIPRDKWLSDQTILDQARNAGSPWTEVRDIEYNQ